MLQLRPYPDGETLARILCRIVFMADRSDREFVERGRIGKFQ